MASCTDIVMSAGCIPAGHAPRVALGRFHLLAFFVGADTFQRSSPVSTVYTLSHPSRCDRRLHLHLELWHQQQQWKACMGSCPTIPCWCSAGSMQVQCTAGESCTALAGFLPCLRMVSSIRSDFEAHLSNCIGVEGDPSSRVLAHSTPGPTVQHGKCHLALLQHSVHQRQPKGHPDLLRATWAKPKAPQAMLHTQPCMST